MTLGFQMHFDKAKKKPTYFPQKILWSLYESAQITEEEYDFWLAAFELKFPDYGNPDPQELDVKHHTIRPDKSQKWKLGNDIHFVVGNRTPRRYQFAPIVKCRGVQEINIICPSEYMNDAIMQIDTGRMSLVDMQQLAYKDGFSCLAEFQLWFNQDFEGRLIHWTDLRY